MCCINNWHTIKNFCLRSCFLACNNLPLPSPCCGLVFVFNLCPSFVCQKEVIGKCCVFLPQDPTVHQKWCCFLHTKRIFLSGCTLVAFEDKCILCEFFTMNAMWLESKVTLSFLWLPPEQIQFERRSCGHSSCVHFQCVLVGTKESI